VVQYSSGLFGYEDEAKNSLKGTSMNLLVLASYAQFGVSAERVGIWANRKGIRNNDPNTFRILFD
jgi:hypothetical protein